MMERYHGKIRTSFSGTFYFSSHVPKSIGDCAKTLDATFALNTRLDATCLPQSQALQLASGHTHIFFKSRKGNDDDVERVDGSMVIPSVRPRPDLG